MTQTTARTRVPLLRALAERWSPRAFLNKPVEAEKLLGLFEAARWAPSSNNEQPWFYLLGTEREPEQHAKILSCLVEGNQSWAKQAPVLGISLAKVTFNRNGKPNRYAFHDAGMSLMSMAVEATALGLHLHAMGGILPDKVREVYGLPADVEAVAGIAVGYVGDVDVTEQRSRKELGSFVFSGNWGNAADLG